jgi:hypothetical protein
MMLCVCVLAFPIGSWLSLSDLRMATNCTVRRSPELSGTPLTNQTQQLITQHELVLTVLMALICIMGVLSSDLGLYTHLTVFLSPR